MRGVFKSGHPRSLDTSKEEFAAYSFISLTPLTSFDRSRAQFTCPDAVVDHYDLKKIREALEYSADDCLLCFATAAVGILSGPLQPRPLIRALSPLTDLAAGPWSVSEAFSGLIVAFVLRTARLCLERARGCPGEDGVTLHQIAGAWLRALHALHVKGSSGKSAGFFAPGQLTKDLIGSFPAQHAELFAEDAAAYVRAAAASLEEPDSASGSATVQCHIHFICDLLCLMVR